MNRNKLRTATLLVIMISGLNALGGQTYSEYKFVFLGTAYQTNSSGNIVATPITDQTLLADAAAQAGITDLSQVAIVYHINGSPPGDPSGDTVDIINTNGTRLAIEFGFWYGDDASLCRSAISNAAGTEVRRIDWIYGEVTTTYSYACNDSEGTAFVSKSFSTDGNGNTLANIRGPMRWVVRPQQGRGTIIVNGTFSLGTPLF